MTRASLIKTRDYTAKLIITRGELNCQSLFLCTIFSTYQYLVLKSSLKNVSYFHDKISNTLAKFISISRLNNKNFLYNDKNSDLNIRSKLASVGMNNSHVSSNN